MQDGPNFTVSATLLTGAKFSGKSLAVEGLVDALLRRGTRIAGVVQRGVFDETGAKIGYDLVTFPGGETSPLARGRPGAGWSFTEDAFERARRSLSDPADLYILDEVGPLELKGGGHMPALKDLLEKKVPALVVVRQELAAYFTRILGEGGKVRVVAVDELPEIYGLS